MVVRRRIEGFDVKVVFDGEEYFAKVVGEGVRAVAVVDRMGRGVLYYEFLDTGDIDVDAEFEVPRDAASSEEALANYIASKISEISSELEEEEE